MTEKEWRELLERFGCGPGENARGGELLTDDCPICKAYGIDPKKDEWKDIRRPGFKIWTQVTRPPGKPAGE